MVREKEKLKCFHCGEDCGNTLTFSAGQAFCCQGCKAVFELLSENNLCTYYTLENSPGSRQADTIHKSRFAYLDDPEISARLIIDASDELAMITFFVPHIHCSSCVWLLENLHKLNGHIISSRVDFIARKVFITYRKNKVNISEIVALMAGTGYEPMISLSDLEKNRQGKSRKAEIIKIGVAGFCFGNIMMMSFPEYFSGGDFQNTQSLKYLFSFLNLFLSLPVLFYCATSFFISGWKGISNKHLNIDAPIALAILVTFTRSVYEIVTLSGPGYLDSMSGIVFFMLAGRYFQNRTYSSLAFDRDYKSYFPVGVMVIKGGTETSVPATQLKPGDYIRVRNNELIPADAILVSPVTHIDYSFLTGESVPVSKKEGDTIYAGARQAGGAVALKVIKPVSQSYLTGLWNNDLNSKRKKGKGDFTETVNKYFTIAVLLTALMAGLRWWQVNTDTALNAFTAVLIVACPCGLLLATTFTYGNIMRVYGRNKFYLRNSDVINQIALCDTIVFDKTGTITKESEITFSGDDLSNYEKSLIAALAGQSSHPLSKKINQYFDQFNTHDLIDHFSEFPGRGIVGMHQGTEIALGNALFITGHEASGNQTMVYISIDDKIKGYFELRARYRTGIKSLVQKLLGKHQLHVLTGDNAAEKENLSAIFTPAATLLFHQLPAEKKEHINKIQQKGRYVMMLGDGLNDAGALQQSHVGIAVSDNTNNFSPACDGILDGDSLPLLYEFIQLAKAGRKIILFTFAFSLIYNFIGLYFAVQGSLAPVIAAVLMPASTISIVLLTTTLTALMANKYALKRRTDNNQVLV